MIERLLTERQTAELLSLSPDTLRRLRQRGELPFVRVGRGVRYRPTAIDRWLREREVEPDRAADGGLARVNEIVASIRRDV